MSIHRRHHDHPPTSPLPYSRRQRHCYSAASLPLVATFSRSQRERETRGWRTVGGRRSWRARRGDHGENSGDHVWYTIAVFFIRCDVVSGAQLPRPAPSHGAKLARLSLFFHAINDRLERPLSMALWRLAFIPSFTTVSSYPSPRETPRLSITATTCRRRGVGSMAAPLSPSSLPVFFASSFCLDCTFVSYCSPHHAQYA